MCNICEETRAVKTRFKRRRKLWELEDKYHCPVIGTCLSVDDLKRLMRQSGVCMKQQPSDYELHVSIVHQAGEKSRITKNLQKLLDRRFSRQVKQLSCLHEAEHLLAHWRDAQSTGDEAGCFWAILTHPHSRDDLMQQLYGEVHMASHLSARSRRKALLRTPQMTDRIKQMNDELGRLHKQNDALLGERNQLKAQIERQRHLAQANPVNQQPRPKPEPSSRPEIDRLQRQIDWLTSRLAEREQQLVEQRQESLAIRELFDETRDELIKTEEHLKVMLKRTTSGHADTEIPNLRGRHVVYVGGRKSLTPHLRTLVEESAGRFSHHDSGREDNRAGLECLLSGADFVFCPIDCISHDACQKVKRCCKQREAQFIPLRASGLSSCITGLREVSSRRV